MYLVFAVFVKTVSLTVDAIVVGGGKVVNVSVTVGYSVIGVKVVSMLEVLGEVGGEVTIGNGVGRVDMLLWLFVEVMKLSTTRRSLFATMKSKSVLQMASEMKRKKKLKACFIFIWCRFPYFRKTFQWLHYYKNLRMVSYLNLRKNPML